MSSAEREHLLSARSDDGLFTLWVSNLPEELNKNGIVEIFKTYGEIYSLYTPPDAHWAYISYKTYKEAEYAIRSLNEQSPMYLNVAFRKKKIQPKTDLYNLPLEPPPKSNEQRDYRYAQNEISHNRDDRRIMPEHLAMRVAQLTSGVPALDINSVYPSQLDPNIYNPFESVGLYVDTNAMWSRGCVNIDELGRRYVSTGRGYTKYHIPKPAYSRIEHEIGRVYEKRRAGFYQYGEDGLQHEIGKCLNCAHATKLRCARCTGFYCSRECQVADWSCHRMECRMIPKMLNRSFRRALVGEFDSPTFSSSSADEPGHMIRKPRGVVELGSLNPLRRPKIITNVANMNNVMDTEAQKDDISIDHASPMIKAPRSVGQVETAIVVENNVVSTINHSQPEGSSTKHVHESPKQQSGSHCPSENKKYDDNARDEKNRAPNPLKPHNKNIQQAVTSGRSNDRAPSVKSSSSTVEAARPDFLKLEQELAFQRDPRAQTNIVNQTPLLSALPVDVPSAVQQEIKPSVQISNSFFSKDSFTDVRVMVVMADQSFWANKNEDIPKIGAMMMELDKVANNYPKVLELIVGETYAVQFDNVWHRAFVLTTKPTTILYIDFGNDEPPQSDDFRSLKDFPTYPAFATRLRLSVNSKTKTVNADEELSVKMIGIDENGIIEVIDHDTKAEIPQLTEVPALAKMKVDEQPSRNLSNTIDSLKVNSEGFISVYVALDNESYAICILTNDLTDQYQLIYEKLTEVCNTADKPTNFSPKIGDFVCGKRDDFWLRGYVFSLGPPIRLALVDEATVSAVEQVMPMPTGYENISAFGSICKLDVAEVKLNVNETGVFTVNEIVNDTGERIIKGVLSKPDNLKNVTCTIKNWKPTPEQKGIGFAELKNNTDVCISAYSSERIMYVRSLDDASLERFHRMIQNVAKWAQTAPKLNELPVIGQLVIAKFVDGNYYRAIVTKLLDGKIGVSYIDYGNSEITTIDQLRLLSDELKEQRSCTAKIILKDVKVGVASTQEVHKYLDLLVGKEQPLICTYEGIPSKDGVTLITATGEIINEKVNEYLTPIWQRQDPSKNMKCFMIDDFELAILGEVGHTVQVLPLFATEPPFKYVLAPFDRELLTHVISIMPEMILKYCTSTKEHYIPRTNELCLAIWEGGWYRGACLNRTVTPTQSLINFVDFGNNENVDHINIRQMTKDFMSPGGLGLSCIVKNLGIELVNGQVPENIQRRIAELVPLNELISVKIIKKSSPETPIEADYEVEFSSVREKLVAEGLAKPYDFNRLRE